MLLSLLIVVACSTTPAPKPVVVAPPLDTEVNTGNDIDIVTVVKYYNFTQKEREKIDKAEKKLNDLLGGNCFKNFMLEADLIQTNNRSNLEVIEHLKKSHYNIKLSMYRKRFSKVVGYTTPSSDQLNFNRKYWDGMSVCDAASNYMHELSHKFGYGHDYKATTRRPKSVPYTLNRAVEACCF